MSCEHPMGDERLVRFDLPESQKEILRGKLRHWIAGIHEDLQAPERLDNPEASRREAGAYERLLVSLTTDWLVLPDEEARDFLATAAKAADASNDYERIDAEHDALHSLLALLEEER